MNTETKKTHRCTNAEKRARIYEIVNLVVRGKTRAEILRFAAETWGVAERQTESYMAASYQVLEESAAFLARRELAKALARLELIFKRAFESNRWRDALAAQVELIRLVGLDNPQKVEIVTKAGKPDRSYLGFLTVEELDVMKAIIQTGTKRMEAQPQPGAVEQNS